MTDLEQRLYVVFLAAARDLGPDLKTLSWFGRNHRSRQEAGMTNSIELTVGGMSDHVRIQLRRQGVMLPSDRASVWQARSAALTNLRCAGVVTAGEADKIGGRMVKAIARECEPLPCDDCDCS